MKIVNQHVELLDWMGSDLSVVNAARVSFNKVSESFDARDSKLISYLARHNHWTPFAHTSLSFRIKCPLFVARQLGKHQVGLVWNEVSRRYVDDEPEFYMPSLWRLKAENVKQGSSDVGAMALEVDGHQISVDGAVESSMRQALWVYQQLLKNDIAPELARMVLPQNTMTEFIWTGNVASFARVCNLRLDSHTQRETQEIAKLIYNQSFAKFPASIGALCAGLAAPDTPTGEESSTNH